MAFASSNQGSSTAVMANPPLRPTMPLLVLPAEEGRTAPACLRDANGA